MPPASDLPSQLRQIVGPDNLLSEADERLVYECDGYTLEKIAPQLVLLPETTREAARIVSLLAKAGVVAARADARRVVLGPLAGNPFPDATPAFFAAMAEALSKSGFRVNKGKGSR